jgi:murein DD-endopeptidase MepM/ murein hydrolase activator NlpD
LEAAAGDAAEAPRFSLPIACELGKTCFVQSYVDLDPGPGAKDFACGSATYNTHTGTDIRLRSAVAAEAGVAVLAGAPGTVLRVRDELADSRITSEAAAKAITDLGCGNATVIDHGGGWTTAYCHMKRGSLVVKPGDKVNRGQKLGSVGYSGLAEFAHVHFEVRKDGKLVDPFADPAAPGSCPSDPAAAVGLWDKAAADLLGYASGEIITAELTGAVPNLDALEDDDRGVPLTAKSAALVLLTRAVNLRTGDRMQLSIRGPGGFAADSTTEPLDRNKATFTRYTGKPLKQSSWPPGSYEGVVKVIRGDRVISERKSTAVLSE